MAVSTAMYVKKALHVEVLALGKNGDIPGLIRFAHRHSRDFTQVDCCVFLQALESTQKEGTMIEPAVDTVVARLRDLISTGELRDVVGSPQRTLSSTCALFCKLGVPLPTVPVDEMLTWESRHIAPVVWAYAKTMQEAPHEMFERVARDVQKRQYDPRCASNVAWALATVHPHMKTKTKLVFGDAISHIVNHCLLNKPYRWTEHDVGSISWAAISFPSSNRDRLYSSIAEHGKHHNPLNFFTAHGIVQIANAMTRTNHLAAASFVENTANAIHNSDKWAEFNAQHFANLMWNLGKHSVRMTPEFWKSALQKGPSLRNAHDCANVAWALKRVNFYDEESLDMLARAVLEFMDDFTMQGLANVAWAFREYEGLEKDTLRRHLVARCLTFPSDSWPTRTLAILGRQLPSPDILGILCNDFLARPEEYSERDVFEVRRLVRDPVTGLDEKVRRCAAHLSQTMAAQLATEGRVSK